MNPSPQSNRPDRRNDPDGRPSAYVQYSSIAFQMLATIGLGVYAGMKLDEWQGNQLPGWTIGLSLLAIFSSLYLFIRGLPKG